MSNFLTSDVFSNKNTDSFLFIFLPSLYLAYEYYFKLI